MKLEWTAKARGELAAIAIYVWNENPAASKRLRQRIEGTAARLAAHPFMGRLGAIAGTRETIPHPNYRMVCQVSEDTVSILSIVHAARQWPPVDEAE